MCTKALLRLERTINSLCHQREGGRGGVRLGEVRGGEGVDGRGGEEGRGEVRGG